MWIQSESLLINIIGGPERLFLLQKNPGTPFSLKNQINHKIVGNKIYTY